MQKGTMSKRIVSVYKFDKLKPTPYSVTQPEISLQISALHENGYPTGCGYDWEYPNLYPAMTCRIWAIEGLERPNVIGIYGPDISMERDSRVYENAARSIKSLFKKMETIRDLRGNPVDAADEACRFVEAVGCNCVWMHENHGVTSLRNNQWQEVKLGRFISMVRENFWNPEVKAA